MLDNLPIIFQSEIQTFFTLYFDVARHCLFRKKSTRIVNMCKKNTFVAGNLSEAFKLHFACVLKIGSWIFNLVRI